MYTVSSFRDSFLANVRFDAPGGCWLWQRKLTATGYAVTQVTAPIRMRSTVHRITYTVLVGPIPVGLTLDHLCRVRHCCNPAHLEPVTQAENNQRAVRQVVTHCPSGHEYTPENTYHYTVGGRQCKTCAKQRSTDRYNARKDAQ